MDYEKMGDSRALKSEDQPLAYNILEKMDAISKRNAEIAQKIAGISANILPASEVTSGEDLKAAPSPGYGGFVGEIYNRLIDMEEYQNRMLASIRQINKVF